MISCLVDMTVPQDSNCAKCCIYCTKEHCECRCPYTLEHKTEKEIIDLDCCSYAYEEE